MAAAFLRALAGDRPRVYNGPVHLLASEAAALDDFVTWLRSRHPGRVAHLCLFGSRARGEGSEDSDLDVLVAIDELTDAEAREIRRRAGDGLTHHDVLLAPLVLSSTRYRELVDRERRIAREIERDGIPL